MGSPSEYPQKESYRLSEVCEFTDTQPYILRFWESEFPQFAPEKRGNGQPIYRSRDIDLVRRIKQLLYEEEYTLDGARKQLEEEYGTSAGRSTGSASRAATPKSKKSKKRTSAAPPPAPPQKVARRAPREPEATVAKVASDGVSRRRYEDAVEEIEHLRLQLRESEQRERRRGPELDRLEDALRAERERRHRAIEVIERLMERLDG